METLHVPVKDKIHPVTCFFSETIRE